MAQMTSAAIDDLPDSDFAYIEPGGKVVDGKTEPRSLRHFPIQDAAHVRNALARLSQSPFGSKARAKVEAAAKKFGIGAPGKALFEMKAEPLTVKRLDRWLSGDISRRILVVPFGGPIPSEKSSLGVDLDAEWFDAATDLYGPFPGLRASRERIVDWHHDDHGVPSGVPSMKGADLGRINLDPDPEDDGYWADWWTTVGEDRRKRIAELERRGVPLFGSSQAVFKTKADTGHIDVWPLIRHTITTSPQNTYAVVPPLKALLAYPSIDEMPADALKALLLGLDATTAELLLSSPDAAVNASGSVGDGAVKAGRVLSSKNEADLRAALRLLADLVERGAFVPPMENVT